MIHATPTGTTHIYGSTRQGLTTMISRTRRGGNCGFERTVELLALLAFAVTLATPRSGAALGLWNMAAHGASQGECLDPEGREIFVDGSVRGVVASPGAVTYRGNTPVRPSDPAARYRYVSYELLGEFTRERPGLESETVPYFGPTDLEGDAYCRDCYVLLGSEMRAEWLQLNDAIGGHGDYPEWDELNEEREHIQGGPDEEVDCLPRLDAITSVKMQLDGDGSYVIRDYQVEGASGAMVDAIPLCSHVVVYESIIPKPAFLDPSMYENEEILSVLLSRDTGTVIASSEGAIGPELAYHYTDPSTVTDSAPECGVSSDEMSANPLARTFGTIAAFRRCYWRYMDIVFRPVSNATIGVTASSYTVGSSGPQGQYDVPLGGYCGAQWEMWVQMPYQDFNPRLRSAHYYAAEHSGELTSENPNYLLNIPIESNMVLVTWAMANVAPYDGHLDGYDDPRDEYDEPEDAWDAPEPTDPEPWEGSGTEAPPEPVEDPLNPDWEDPTLELTRGTDGQIEWPEEIKGENCHMYYWVDETGERTLQRQVRLVQQPDIGTDVELWEEGETEHSVEFTSSCGQDHQGLVTQISHADMMDTSVYVFRDSDDQLMGSRWGLNEIHLDCDESVIDPSGLGSSATLEVGVATMCPEMTEEGNAQGHAAVAIRQLEQTNQGEHWYQGIYDFDLRPPEDLEFGNDLRAGERIRVIVVNHATGYVGSGYSTVGPSTTSNLIEGALSVVNLELRPPNLRVWAERGYTAEDSRTGDPSRRHLIGAEGSALTSDSFIKIHTEWVDFDGSPLPAELPGFTGRLSTVQAELMEDQTRLLHTGTGEEADGEFSIRPGRHTEVVELPVGDDGIERSHFYVHVAGISLEEGLREEDEQRSVYRGSAAAQWESNTRCYWRATSSSGSFRDPHPEDPCDGVDNDDDGEIDEGCEPIPDMECITRREPPEPPTGEDVGDTGPDTDSDADADADIGEQDDRFEYGRPWAYVPVRTPIFDRGATEYRRSTYRTLGLADPGPVYRWVYRPEAHFSVVSLVDVDVNRVDSDGNLYPMLDGEDWFGGSDRYIEAEHDIEGELEDASQEPECEYGDEGCEEEEECDPTADPGCEEEDPPEELDELERVGDEREYEFLIGDSEGGEACRDHDDGDPSTPPPPSADDEECEDRVWIFTQEDMEDFDEDDLLTLRLAQDGDEPNSLWELVVQTEREQWARVEHLARFTTAATPPSGDGVGEAGDGEPFYAQDPDDTSEWEVDVLDPYRVYHVAVEEEFAWVGVYLIDENEDVDPSSLPPGTQAPEDEELLVGCPMAVGEWAVAVTWDMLTERDFGPTTYPEFSIEVRTWRDPAADTLTIESWNQRASQCVIDRSGETETSDEEVSLPDRWLTSQRHRAQMIDVSEAQMMGQAEHAQVRLQDGSLNMFRQDLLLPGVGPDIALSRAYDGADPRWGLLGPNWRLLDQWSVRSIKADASDDDGIPDWIYEAPEGALTEPPDPEFRLLSMVRPDEDGPDLPFEPRVEVIEVAGETFLWTKTADWTSLTGDTLEAGRCGFQTPTVGLSTVDGWGWVSELDSESELREYDTTPDVRGVTGETLSADHLGFACTEESPCLELTRPDGTRFYFDFPLFHEFEAWAEEDPGATPPHRLILPPNQPILLVVDRWNNYLKYEYFVDEEDEEEDTHEDCVRDGYENLLCRMIDNVGRACTFDYERSRGDRGPRTRLTGITCAEESPDASNTYGHAGCASTLTPAEAPELSIHFEYDDGYLSGVSRGDLGPLETYEYEAPDHFVGDYPPMKVLSAILDGAGNGTRYEYYSTGMSTLADTPGIDETNVDRNRLIASISTDIVGGVTGCAGAVNSGESVLSFEYNFDEDTRTVTHSEAVGTEGRETLYELNSVGNPVKITHPDGRIDTTGWPLVAAPVGADVDEVPSNRPAWIATKDRDSPNRVHRLFYNDCGSVEQVNFGPSTGELSGDSTPMLDETLRTIQMEYHADYPTLITEREDSLTGTTETWTYTDEGQLSRYVGPGGNATSYQISREGLVTQESDPSLSTLSYRRYDRFGLLLAACSPERSKPVEYQNDWRGRVRQVVDGTLTTSLDYDEYDRPTVTTRGALGVAAPTGLTRHLVTKTANTYDSAGRLSGFSDFRGLVWGVQAGTFGNTRLAREPASSEIYGLTGSTREAASSATTTWQYDVYGRVVGETDAMLNTTCFTHTDEADSGVGGSTMTAKDRDNVETRTVFDGWGNVILEYEVGAPAPRFVHTYDEFGRWIRTEEEQVLASFDGTTASGVSTAVSARKYIPREEAGTVEVGVDGMGEPIMGPGMVQTAGHWTHTIDPAGRVLLEEFDGAGRPLAVYAQFGTVGASNEISLTGTPELIATYVYDSGGRLTTRQDGSGICHRYEYDLTNGRLVAEALMPASSCGSAPTSASRYTAYAYDPETGQLTTSTEHGTDGDEMRARATTFEYDDWGRVYSAESADYTTYIHTDGGGEIVQVVNAANEATTTERDKLGRVVFETTAGLATANGVDTASPGGVGTRYAYDPLGNLTSRIDPAGTTTLYEWVDGRRLDAIVHAAGLPEEQGTRFGYSADPLLPSTMTESDGGSTTMTWNLTYAGDTLMSKCGRPEGMTEVCERWIYDAAGQLVGQQALTGEYHLAEYDARGLPVVRATARSAPTGGTPQGHRDLSEACVSGGASDYRPVTIDYDPAGRPREEVDVCASTTVQTIYDSYGRPERTIARGSDATDGIVSRVSYNDFNEIRAEWRPYFGGASTEPPAGSAVEYTYNLRGLPATTTLPSNETGGTNRAELNHQYDAAGRLNSTTSTHAILAMTVDERDDSGRPTRVTQGGMVSRMDYWWDGRVRRSYEPHRVEPNFGMYTQHTYDALGRLTESLQQGLDGDSIEYEFTYHRSGETESITEVGGDYTWSQTYNGIGLPLRTTDGTAVLNRSYSSNASGGLTVTQTGAQSEIREFDWLGRPTSAVYSGSPYPDEDLAAVTWMYPTETRVEITEARTTNSGSGVVTQIATETIDHDIFGRQINRSGANPQFSVSTDYAADGSPTALAVSAGSHSRTTDYSYAPSGMLETLTVGGKLSTYRYLPDGRIDEIERASGLNTSFNYDESHRLGTIQHAEGTGAAAPVHFGMAYDYDQWDRPTSRVLTADGRVITSTYDYDSLHRVTDADETDQFVIELPGPDAEGEEITRFAEYEYTGSNRTNEQTCLGLSFDSDSCERCPNELDILGRCLAETVENESCDEDRVLPDGTCCEEPGTVDGDVCLLEFETGPPDSDITYVFGAQNRLMSSADAISGATVTYGYDPRGNQTSVVADEDGDGTADFWRRYEFNRRNQLAAVYSGPSDEETEVGRYGYDRFGQRVRVRGTDRDSNAVYAGIHLLLETDPTGGHLATYHHDTFGVAAASLPGSGGAIELDYMHRDALGSVIGYSRGVTQNPGRTLDVWGMPRPPNYGPPGPDAASLHATNVGYTGHQHDWESGLIYMNARHMDPGTGRFLTQDPFLGHAGVPASAHRYGYVHGSPTLYTDPSGHFIPVVPLVIAGVVSVGSHYALRAGGGAVIGAGLGVVLNLGRQTMQALDNPSDWEGYDWGEVGRTAAYGAAAGAVIGVTGNVGMLAGGTLGAVGAVNSGNAERRAGNGFTAAFDYATAGLAIFGARSGARGIGRARQARAVDARVRANLTQSRSARESTGDGFARMVAAETQIVQAAGTRAATPQTASSTGAAGTNFSGARFIEINPAGVPFTVGLGRPRGPSFSLSQVERIMAASQNRRFFAGSQKGHPRDHVPRPGRTAEDLALDRPGSSDTTVYISARSAIRDIRAWMNANRDALANLAPGKWFGTRGHGGPTPTLVPRTGIHGFQPGGRHGFVILPHARTVTFTKFTIGFTRLSDGTLHMHHFAPSFRAPKGGAP